jgi:hypothetical protein
VCCLGAHVVVDLFWGCLLVGGVVEQAHAGGAIELWENGMRGGWRLQQSPIPYMIPGFLGSCRLQDPPAV